MPIEVDASQVHSIEVDPSQVRAVYDPLTSGAPDVAARMRAEALAKAPPGLYQDVAPATPQYPVAGGMSVMGGLPGAWTSPAEGARQLATGVEHLAGSMGHGGGAWYDPAASQYHIEDTRHAALGASDVIRGALQMGKPLLPVAAVAAPVATAAALGLGTATSPAVEKGLQALGVAPEYSQLAGDVAGLYAGGKAAEFGPEAAAALGRGLEAAKGKLTTLPRLGTPEQQAAVDWALAHDIPLSAGAATLNPLIRGTEEIMGATPGAGTATARAIEARNAAYGQVGRAMAEQIAPGAVPPTPESVGRAVRAQTEAQIGKLSGEATAEYNALRDRELDPNNIVRVQTGTRDVPDFDENGVQFGTHQEPIFENVGLPVDMAGVKAAAKPVLDRISRLTQLGQQQYAPMQLALEDIVRGPDVVSASTAEGNLGAFKKVARSGKLAEGAFTPEAGLAADTVGRLQGAIDDAVKGQAGNDALTELQTARMKTAQKWEAVNLIQDFQKEPVKFFNQMSETKDGGIDFLRAVNEVAPEQMPNVGRALMEGAINKATVSGGFEGAPTLFNWWRNLGDSTKQVLFKDPQMISDWNNFFQSAKDSARIENTSKTARVAHIGSVLTQAGTAAGLMLYHPAAGLAMGAGLGAELLAGNALARALYSPRFVRAAIRAFNTPVSSPAAASAAGALASAARSISSGGGGGAPPGAPPVAPVGKPPVGPSGAPPGGAAASPEGSIAVPGQSGPGYKVTYGWHDLDAVQASHNGRTFAENPNYAFENQRNYALAANQGKIVSGGSRADFNPEYLLSRSPDASNGPPIGTRTQPGGDLQLLSGNGRKMIMDRVFDGNPAGRDAYLKLANERAAQFGLGPAPEGMSKPIIAAEISPADLAAKGGAERAIADFNKSGTAELTPAERMISDSRRVSEGTLGAISDELERKGSDATINEALEGGAGIDVLNRLIRDGVISPQERAKLADNEELTADGKKRISGLVVGRFFSDPAALEAVPDRIRGKVERMAAPLAQVDNAGDWSLTAHMQEALSILHTAEKRGFKNVGDFIAQDSLFGAQKYAPQAVELAQALQSRKSLDLQRAARQYAAEASYAEKSVPGGLFGESPTPANSFADAFGPKKPPPAPANALAPTTIREEEAVEAPKNALAGKPAPAAAPVNVLAAKKRKS